jgi:molybdopterin converting factor small subunit
MRVKVKVVGPLHQYVGNPQSMWDLPDHITVKQLVGLLGSPESIRRVPIIMAVVNDKLTNDTVELKDGDDVDLLWPMGGG